MRQLETFKLAWQATLLKKVLEFYLHYKLPIKTSTEKLLSSEILLKCITKIKRTDMTLKFCFIELRSLYPHLWLTHENSMSWVFFCFLSRLCTSFLCEWIWWFEVYHSLWSLHWNRFVILPQNSLTARKKKPFKVYFQKYVIKASISATPEHVTSYVSWHIPEYSWNWLLWGSISLLSRRNN